MTDKKSCCCMKIARPLVSGDSLHPSISLNAMRESCTNWLRDHLLPLPDLKHPDKERIEQEYAQSAGIPIYSHYPTRDHTPLMLPIGDGRAAFIDRLGIQTGRFYLTSSDAEQQQDALESFVVVVIRQWVEEKIGQKWDDEKSVEYVKEHIPVSLAHWLLRDREPLERSSPSTLRAIEQFRRSVVLRAGLPATPTTARYLFKRWHGLPVDKKKDRPTRGVFVVTFGIQTFEQLSGGNYVESLAHDQVVHQITAQSPWVTASLLKKAHNCAKTHAEWLASEVNVPCECESDFDRRLERKGILRVPDPDLRRLNKRPRSNDERATLMQEYLDGGPSRERLEALLSMTANGE